jgi:hypothetical protein
MAELTERSLSIAPGQEGFGQISWLPRHFVG